MQRRPIKSPPASLVFAVWLWFGIGVALFLVAPVFSAMFRDFGASLPLVTRVTLGFSEWLRSYWFLTLPFFLGALISATRLLRRKERDGMPLLIAAAVLTLWLVFSLLWPVYQLGAGQEPLQPAEPTPGSRT